MIVAGSVAVVATVFQQIAALHSIDTRDAMGRVLDQAPFDASGISVDDLLGVIKVLSMIAAACATATAILGWQALQRSKSARIALSVLAVPLFLTGVGTGGVLSTVVAVAIGLLWLQPARDWFDGRWQPQPDAPRTPADGGRTSLEQGRPGTPEPRSSHPQDAGTPEPPPYAGWPPPRSSPQESPQSSREDQDSPQNWPVSSPEDQDPPQNWPQSSPEESPQESPQNSPQGASPEGAWPPQGSREDGSWPPPPPMSPPHPGWAPPQQAWPAQSWPGASPGPTAFAQAPSAQTIWPVAPPAIRRPRAVIASAVLTWVCSVLLGGLVVGAASWLIASPDALLAELTRQNPELARDGTLTVGLVRTMLVLMAGALGLWVLGVCVVAYFVLRGASWARWVLLVSSGVAGLGLVVCTLANPVMAVPLAGAIAVFALLLRKDVVAWFSAQAAQRRAG
ncbi:hypothetical protein JCM18899A_01930 [Nocardioides sp. AN3]